MSSWFKLLPAAPAALVPVAVHATQYLSVEAARHAAFPTATFVPVTIGANALQAAAARSGIARSTPAPQLWQARDGTQTIGWTVVDRVIGKHELITYLVALDMTGAVQRVEILDYRELYGGEIRNPRWLAQFIGKRSGAAVKIDRDIRNISGATLSSRHVTDGVRYVLALHAAMAGKAA